MLSEKGKFIELSHTIEDGSITYKGLPAPKICDFWTREYSKSIYEEGETFQISQIEMVSNTGTYIDVPFHRFAEGKDLAEISLEKVALLPAICIHVKGEEVKAIGKEYFEGKDLKNKAVLVNTGWGKYFQTETYYNESPFLKEEAAKFLLEQEVTLVGIDSHNIDDTSQKRRPVHSILLGAEILIVEHLCNLDLIPEQDFYFTAIPPKIKGVGSFPVRAFAYLS